MLSEFTSRTACLCVCVCLTVVGKTGRTDSAIECTGSDSAGMSRRSSGVMGNPDLQLRTDSLGLTPLLAPLSPLASVKVAPQPQHGLPSKTLHSSGGNGLPSMAVEVAAFDCGSSTDSIGSMTGRHDSKLIGKRTSLLVSASQTSCFRIPFQKDILAGW